LLGITFSSTDALREWRDAVGLKSHLLSDSTRSVAMAYGAADNVEQAKAGRVSVLIDENGEVMRIYRPTDVSDHAAEVLRDLAALARAPRS
jgi:peroxiredoxin